MKNLNIALFMRLDDPVHNFPLSATTMSYRKGLLLTSALVVLIYGFGLTSAFTAIEQLDLSTLQEKVRSMIAHLLLLYFLVNFAIEAGVDVVVWKNACEEYDLRREIELRSLEIELSEDNSAHNVALTRDRLETLRAKNRSLTALVWLRFVFSIGLPVILGIAASYLIAVS